MGLDLRATLKHTSIYGITNILKKGAAFFMIPVYTHYLSPSDYGILELLELILDLTTLLIGLRLSDAVIRYYHHYQSPEEKNEVISTAFLFSLVVAAGSVLILQFTSSSLSHYALKGNAPAHYVSWIFFCLGCRLLNIVPEAQLMVAKRSVTYSGLSFVTFVLSLSLNILFLVGMGLGVRGMLYSMMITSVTYMLLLFSVTLPKLSWRFSMEKLGQMITFGLPLLPGILSLFLVNFADRFFIQHYCSSHELGIYSLGYKFGTLLVVLMTDPFFRIWNTQRYEIAASKEGPQIIGRYFTYYFLGLVTLTLGLWIFSKDIIQLLADPRFLDAAHIVPLISLSYLLQGIAGFATLGIMVSYKTRYILYANLATAAVNLAMNFMLIPALGIYGAAVSTIVSYGFLFVIVLVLAQNQYRIEFEIPRLVRVAAVAAAVIWLSGFVPGAGFAPAVKKASILLLFPLGIIFSGFLTAMEKDQIRRAFR